MKVERLTPSIGAEIIGLDLSRPVPEPVSAELKRLLVEMGVLVIRDQRIGDEAHLAFARSFGELEVFPAKELIDSNYPEILEIADAGDKSKYSSVTQTWHTDGAFRKVPASVTVLRPVEIAPVGGETCFANVAAGYDALPDDRKRAIADLKAIHDLEYAMGLVPGLPGLSAEDKVKAPPVEHPIVRVHPISGRKVIYLSNHAREIVGMPVAQGRALLKELTDWTTQPQFVYQHRWRIGDIVAWDNRGTLHRVLPYDSTAYRRVMRRAEVSGVAA